MARIIAFPSDLEAAPPRDNRRPFGSNVSLAHVWWTAALFAAGLAAGLMPIESIDYWWTVKMGDWIRQHGVLPTGDPLLYTAIREPVIDGQWLAQVLFSVAHTIDGPNVALAARMVISIAAAALMLRMCAEEGAGVRASAAGVAIGSLLFVPGLAARPQMLAVLPFLIVLRASFRPPRTVLGLVGVALIFIFWVNVHGSFVLAYVCLSLGAFDAAWSRWHGRDLGRLKLTIRLGILLLPAALVNPYGWRLLAYVWDVVVFNGVGSAVGVLGVEWGPPILRSTYGGAFFASVLVVIGLLGAGRKPRCREVVLMLFFGLLALQAIRNVAWWGLIVAPYVARAISHPSRPTLLMPGDSPGRGQERAYGLPVGVPSLNVMCIGLLVTLLMLFLPWWREKLPLPASRTAVLDQSTPVALGEYLAQNQPDGNLFHHTDWGAYLGWRIGPDRKIFVDDRFELHPPDVWRDYARVSGGHASWEEVLERYGVVQVALDAGSQPGLAEAIGRTPRWDLKFQDGDVRVYQLRAAR
ncbi:MAG: hypothetical protein U0821_18915 [Chloroflexota bacterium]